MQGLTPMQEFFIVVGVVSSYCIGLVILIGLCYLIMEVTGISKRFRQLEEEEKRQLEGK